METFKDKNILIIGTGKMGRLALQYVMENNPGKVYMTNRNHDKVVDLRDRYPDIETVNYNDKHDLLSHVDAVITATASPHHVIRKEDIPEQHRALNILDLAMPQDVDENVVEMKNVVLYNVDSLNKISEENERKRKELSIKAKYLYRRQTQCI